LTQAKSIMIVDDMSRELASEFSTSVRKAIKVIEEEFKPDIEKAHQLHKGLLDRMKKLCAPFRAAQIIVDDEIRRDWREREEERREEERREAAMVAAERKRQEAALAQASTAALEKGDLEEARALADSQIAIAAPIPAPTLSHTVKSAAGSTTVRKDIEVVVVDKGRLIAAVASGLLPDLLLVADVGAAKRYVKANGLTGLPGCEVRATAIVSGRIG